MYTDNDLDHAVVKGVFSEDAVGAFRQLCDKEKRVDHVDEENFRLLSGFNDIFVVIASGLLLVSVGLLLNMIHPALAAACVALISWLLAEFFVRRKRMALPAIFLLLSFIAGVSALPIVITYAPQEAHFIGAAVLSLAAAYIHWRRFRVPITIAAASGCTLLALYGAIYSAFPAVLTIQLPVMFGAGVVLFVFAMYWDSKDPARQTRFSDVAFWLHLLAAPLLVHPVFASLGLLNGAGIMASSWLAVALYLVLALVSIAIDRRAIMVSALIYLVYAFSGVLQTYGFIQSSFAIAGGVIGFSLLLLSVYWHRTRDALIRRLPEPMTAVLPHSQG